MTFPEGYSDYLKENKMFLSKNDPNKYCLKLKKAIYGLVQAARQWWKKFKTVIENMGYTACDADPCLFIKDNPTEGTKSFIAIYVDDGGIFSSEDNIKEVLHELGKHFKVKYLGKLENFLGCKIIENKEKDTIYIHQPKLIKNLKLTFEKYVTDSRSYKTPAGPKTSIMRPEKGDPLISEDKQQLFRSGVGMLLWLVKHSRPDINNAVRELSKVADGATEAHCKELLRAIGYVLKTEQLALKMKPIKNGELFCLQGISDSNYAEDKETRFSVYGYVVYFCGVPIAWKSKSGKSVTLSSTEAECFAISEVAKEILFVKQILECMGVQSSN
jgi:Reverse transcriptase (RNA-dependent DNA polymerase)